MNDKDKNAKKDPVAKAAEAAFESVKCKCGAHWKVLVGALIVVIILLHTFWSMMENNISQTVAKEIGAFTVELQSVKSNLAVLGARVSETEKEAINHEAIKEDIESIRGAAEEFEKKLTSVIKAEEEKLLILEKNVENQKAYIDELKRLLERAP